MAKLDKLYKKMMLFLNSKHERRLRRIKDQVNYQHQNTSMNLKTI